MISRAADERLDIGLDEGNLLERFTAHDEGRFFPDCLHRWLGVSDIVPYEVVQ